MIFCAEISEIAQKRGNVVDSNGMRVTCRFLRDALNTGSYLELHRRRFARIPETCRLFMYSKLTEYMNNYGVPKRRKGSETRTKEGAREREREKARRARSY